MRVRAISVPRWIDGIWLVLLALYGLVGVGYAPLHGDETTLIYMGRDYFYQFVEGDLSKVVYAENPDAIQESGATQQQLRLLNGTLPKYLFGWSAFVQGYTLDDINDQWDWSLDWAQNEQRGAIPDDALLYGARLTAWLAWVISVVALFGLTHISIGRLGAYVASAIFVLNPAVLMHGQRAMMDSFMLAGMILVVWAGFYVSKKAHWYGYVALGIAGGLALASKHTSLFVLVAVFGALGLQTLWQYRQQSLRRLLWLVASGALVLSIFYALNPAWWGNPITRAQGVLAERQTLLEGQIATFGGYESFGEQVGAWLRQSFMVEPMYYEVDSWVNSSQAVEDIGDYTGQWYAGIAPMWLCGIALAILSVMGLWANIQKLRQGHLSFGILLAWMAMMVVLTLIVTPLEWQRYYLPMYPVIAWLVAMGISARISITHD
jgi:4-amino-4-deoxy-L-arabinose transferase-like glycosyltransferase